MALPNISQQDATLAIAAEGAVMSNELNDIDNSLVSIFDVLVDMTRVNERTAKAIEEVLRIESARRSEENLTEGLKLEAEREAGQGQQGKGFGERYDKAVDKFSADTTTMGLALVTATGAALAFADEVKDAYRSVEGFLSKFGIGVDETVTALAAARAGLPKGYTTAPKAPTATPPAVTPKTPPAVKGDVSKTVGKKLLQSAGLEDIKAKSVPVTKSPAAKVQKSKEVAKAVAKATSDVSGNVAKTVTRTVSKVATPVMLGMTAYELQDIYNNPQMSPVEKKVAYSEVGGRVTGALSGATLGGKLGLAAGPWGALFGSLAGGLAGAILGEELGEFLGKMGFEDNQMTMQERLATIPEGGDEYSDIGGDPFAVPEKKVESIDSIMGRRTQQVQKEAQLQNKIKGVKPTVAGDNVNITVKVDQASKEKVDPARVTPIIRQGDTINKNTIINNGGGGSTSGKPVPAATKQNRSSGATGYTEIWDPVVDGP